MRLAVFGNETNLRIYETRVETPKAILCNVYDDLYHGQKELWIPKSQITEKNNDIIELTPWFLGKAFDDFKIYFRKDYLNKIK